MLALVQTLPLGWAVHTFVVLLVAVVIFAILYALVKKLPLQEPTKQWAYIALYVLAAIVAIVWLLSFIGYNPHIG